MKKVKLEGILVDKCGNCAGVYLIKAELELLTDHKESESFSEND
ncbi:MAG: zf-TFIIB domain-containing protein [Lentisphaerales bacterium]|nr:zf-TFIIB domain-containing protein [Lentisphaerales bacterium]